jgi:ferrochelatase
MSSYESAVVEVEKVASQVAPWIRLRVVPPFFEHPRYLDALAAVSAPYLKADDDRHLLFSFHGVPERHILKADVTGCHCLKAGNCCESAEPSPAHKTCYRRQCIRTVSGFASRTSLASGTYSYAFQSRLGKDKWLEPATQDQLVRLARSGVRKLTVLCPAFAVDCLETLEEIGIRAKETFLAEGGAEFRMIPCLNDHPVWVRSLAMIAREHGVIPLAEPAMAPEVM